MQKKFLLICKGRETSGIEDVLAQLAIPSESARDAGSVKKKIKRGDVKCALFDDDTFSGRRDPRRFDFLNILKDSKKGFLFLTSSSSFSLADEAMSMGAQAFIARPYNCREFILRVNACYHKKKRISCLGGGTGLFNLLVGLKKLPHVIVNSIVAMSDDGGSTGRLRESFGILPPGDVRRNLVALSNAPALMNEVLQHRFKSGGETFEGHNFGNLFLAVLAEIKGSMKEGIKCLGDILNIQGIVIPVTDTRVMLKAMFEEGTVISGESRIDAAEGRHPGCRIKDLWHEPKAECNIDAYTSLLMSDAIVIGPGDLFTSVITNLVVEHIPEAIAKSGAKKIYVCNLMTKPGETARYGVFEHVREIINYLGGDHLDYVIVSNTKLSEKGLRRYKAKGQFPVTLGNLRKIREITRAKIIMADVGHETDLVRHDSEKLRKLIGKLLGIKAR